MALISDPRIFVVPRFHFQRDGAFALDIQDRRPDPEELFSCKIIDGIKTPSLPKRVGAEPFPVVWGEKNVPVILLSSVEKYIPIFWRVELFSQQGRACEESAYSDFYQFKRADVLVYISLTQSKRYLELRMEGRLIEIMLYLICFEADERMVGNIMKLLQDQAIQKAVSTNWQELMSATIVDLSTGGSSLCTQLVEKYGSAVETAMSLLPKPRRKSFFEKMFGQ